jgi:hypothetical protein
VLTGEETPIRGLRLPAIVALLPPYRKVAVGSWKGRGRKNQIKRKLKMLKTSFMRAQDGGGGGRRAGGHIYSDDNINNAAVTVTEMSTVAHARRRNYDEWNTHTFFTSATMSVCMRRLLFSSQFLRRVCRYFRDTQTCQTFFYLCIVHHHDPRCYRGRKGIETVV